MRKSSILLLALGLLCVWACSEKEDKVIDDTEDGFEEVVGEEVEPGFTAYKPGDVLGAWEEGSLDIHFINTGRGECSFLIFPDGTTLLVDCAGATTSNFEIAWKPNYATSTENAIVNYINHFTSKVSSGKIDYVLLSHFDGDHVGYYYDGVLPAVGDGTFYRTSLCGIGVQLPFGHYFDRGYPDYDLSNTEFHVDDEEMEMQVANIQKFVTWTVAANGTVAEWFDPGKLNQIKMLHNPSAYPDFQIQNLSSNGYYWTGEGENYEANLPETYASSAAWPGENTRSTAFWLTFGKFDYYTGGDHQYNDSSNYSYKDSEAPMVPVIGKMDVIKANHHGSSSTAGQDFMNATAPYVWVANVWRSTQPNGDTVQRVLKANSSCDLYSTNFGSDATASESDFIATQGHVVVRVAPSATQYYVYVLDDSNSNYKVKNVKSYLCR